MYILDTKENKLIYRQIFYILILFLVNTSVSQAENIDNNISKTDSQYLTYKGAWFTIDYPKSFKVKPSISYDDTSYDSIFFSSLDNEVTFYVCSPLWSIACDDIKLDTLLETKGEVETIKNTKSGLSNTVNFYTITAKDGSYLRSYQESVQESTRWIIGIKYKNGEVLKKYRMQYLHFKNSLLQFSD